MTVASAPPETTPASVRLVERLGRRLSGSGVTRRRFLTRAAIVGAALALDPWRYLLRPGTAYARVCGDGASCGSGWTAFCCTINGGANTCPPGSFVAGWWRIDDSPFCLGAARYVIDCNRTPGASCSCRCASGSCDQRRVCCNVFRYGQCNTQIAGTTEVVCRVVTCTAPWDWDPACSRTVRVDNRTRSHNAPCLPGRDATPIAIKYQDLGMTGSVLGAPTSAEGDAAAGGRFRRYERGTIFWLSSIGARALYGPIEARHRATGGSAGPLGYPTTDVQAVGDGEGLRARFQRGTVYRAGGASEAVEVYDPLDRHYREEEGGPRGPLGYPRSSSRRGNATLTRFAEGARVATASGTIVSVRPEVLDAAEEAPDGSPDRVGWPIAEEEPSGPHGLQRFEQGLVVRRGGGGWVAMGADLAGRYLELGAAGGELGRPMGLPETVADGRGRAVETEFGALYVGPGTGARALQGRALDAYRDAGGPDGTLGLPTSEPVRAPNGQLRTSFERGALIVETDGSVSQVSWRQPRRPGDLTGAGVGGDGARTSRSPSDLTDR